MNWFIFALLSVVALAGSEISQKASLMREEDISAITNNAFVWTIQGLGGLAVALFLGQFVILSDPTAWLKLLVLAVVYFFGGTFFYTSYKSNSPSVSIVLGSVSVIISTLIGILFFSESTIIMKFVGIALIMAAILFINYSKGKFNLDKYNLLALAGGGLFGIAFSIDKSFALELPAFTYLAYMSLSVGLLSFFLKGKHVFEESKCMDYRDFYPILSSAFFAMLFNVFSFMSYAGGGNVGAVDAINNTSVFLVILAEIFLFRDRSNLLKKFIAAGTAGVGLILLALI